MNKINALILVLLVCFSFSCQSDQQKTEEIPSKEVVEVEQPEEVEV